MIKGLCRCSLRSWSRLSSLAVVLSLFSSLIFNGCGHRPSEGCDGFPPGFEGLDDARKVAYVMQSSTPDSVARFICNAALGRLQDVRIDTLPVASAYAYEHYSDSSLMVFSREFDDYSANLPLSDKMKVYYMAGTFDAQRLGYELGLEYVDHIRQRRMNVEEINNEIEAFKTACGQDTLTYVRFMKGFKTVLKADHGKDLPEDVYNAFID